MDLEATPDMGANESLSPVERIESIISEDLPPEPEKASQPDREPAPAVEEAAEPKAEKPKAEEKRATSDTEAEDAEEVIEYDADDVASLFGIDPESLSINEDGTASFKTKVNGEEGTATLADLIKGHQIEANVNRKSVELSEAQKAFDAERVARFQALDQQMQVAGGLVQQMENELMREYNSVNWETLRNADPAEYAAKQQDYNARYQQIQGYKANVLQQQAQQSEQLKRAQHEWTAKEIDRNQGELLKVVPEWADAKLAAKEATAVEKLLIDVYGFTPDEAGGTIDYRVIHAGRDLMRYHQMINKVQPSEKKVKRKLRSTKTGHQETKTEANRSAKQKRRAAFKRSGKAVDAAKVIEDLI